MNAAVILADVQIIVGIARLAIQLGQDVAPFVEILYQLVFKNQPLTPEQRGDMMRKEDELRALLNKPDEQDAADAAANG